MLYHSDITPDIIIIFVRYGICKYLFHFHLYSVTGCCSFSVDDQGNLVHQTALLCSVDVGQTAVFGLVMNLRVFSVPTWMYPAQQQNYIED